MPYKDKEKQKERNREYQKIHYSKKKKYYIDKAAERQKRIKIEFDKIKSELKCKICGENHPSCLDFHHIDPKEKEINISSAIVAGWSTNRIKKEIEKCDVLCANCHRKHHYLENKLRGGCNGNTIVS